MSKINGSTQIKEGSITESALDKALVFDISTVSVRDRMVFTFSGEDLPIVPNKEGTGYEFPNFTGHSQDTIVSFNNGPAGVRSVDAYYWEDSDGTWKKNESINTKQVVLVYSKSVLNPDGTEQSPRLPMAYIVYKDEAFDGGVNFYNSYSISELVSTYYSLGGSSKTSPTQPAGKRYVRKAIFTLTAGATSPIETLIPMNINRALPADAELSSDGLIFKNGVLEDDPKYKFAYVQGVGNLILGNGIDQLYDGDKFTVIVEYLTSTAPSTTPQES